MSAPPAPPPPPSASSQALSSSGLLPLRVSRESADPFAPLARHGVDAGRLSGLRRKACSSSRRLPQQEEGEAPGGGRQGGDPEEAALAARLGALQEYHSALRECAVDRKIPGGRLEFSWGWEGAEGEEEEGSSSFVAGAGWDWERRNVLAGVLAVECRRARAALAANPRTGINRGVPLLQGAAALAGLLASKCGGGENWDGDEASEGGQGQGQKECRDLPPALFSFWEAFLLAEAQRHAYHAFAAMGKPGSLLAKMAAGCAPLYAEAARRASSPPEGPEEGQAGRWPRPGRERCRSAALAWGAYCGAAAERRQAEAHLEKREGGAGRARLARALGAVDRCDGLLRDAGEHDGSGAASSPAAGCRELAAELRGEILDRIASLPPPAEEEDDDAVPDLPEIQPTPPLKPNPASLAKLLPVLPPVHDPPLFRAPQPQSPPQSEREHPATAAPPSPPRGRSAEPGGSPRGGATADAGGGGAPAGRDLDPPARGPREPPEQPLLSQPPAAAATTTLQEARGAVDDLAHRAAVAADEARRALALAGLPHSVASYRRRHHEGGGIPADLWRRVRDVQRTQQDETLKSRLWQLRDDSERAQRTFRSIRSQLEEDLDLDRMFRELHGGDFVGHKVDDVQLHFRRVLNDYSRLMASAQESDRILSDKLQILETDPKFQLLKFRKEQLDRLLPAGGGAGGGGGGAVAPPPPVDVSELSECLVALSEGIDRRDAKVGELQDLVDRVAHAVGEAEADGGEDDSKRSGAGAGGAAILEDASRHIRDQIAAVQRDLQEQKALVRRILVLNEAFLSARNAAITTPGASAATESSSNVLERLGDALDELDQFASHLEDGTAFYKVIIPKLEKLQHNVGDVSARLAVERCEYDDRVRRSRQEEEDARVASEMSSSPHHPGSGSAASASSSLGSSAGGADRAPGSGGSGGGGYGAPAPHHQHPQHQQPPPTPRVEQVSHADGPPVRVDDAKVAGLIELGFDPDRAAGALRRHHNDMERAINDLLS